MPINLVWLLAGPRARNSFSLNSQSKTFRRQKELREAMHKSSLALINSRRPLSRSWWRARTAPDEFIGSNVWIADKTSRLWQSGLFSPRWMINIPGLMGTGGCPSIGLGLHLSSSGSGIVAIFISQFNSKSSSPPSLQSPRSSHDWFLLCCMVKGYKKVCVNQPWTTRKTKRNKKFVEQEDFCTFVCPCAATSSGRREDL